MPTASCPPPPSAAPGDVSEITGGPVVKADLGDLKAIDPGLAQLIAFPARSRAAWGTDRYPEVPFGPLPAALWQCQARQTQENPPQQLLDRETGCLLAIVERWVAAHRGAAGSVDPEALAQARTIHGYAVTALGPKARSFLRSALAPGITSYLAGATDRPTELRPWKEIRRLGPKAISPTTVLQLVRDAWASDLVYAAQTMSEFFGSSSDGTMLAGGVRLSVLADQPGAGLLTGVYSRRPSRSPSWADTLTSVASMCAIGFPGGWSSGESERGLSCYGVLRTMWEGYQQTGEPAFFDAAAAIYRTGLAVANREGSGSLFKSLTKDMDG